MQAGFQVRIAPIFVEVSKVGDDRTCNLQPAELSIDTRCFDEESMIKLVKKYFEDLNSIREKCDL